MTTGRPVLVGRVREVGVARDLLDDVHAGRGRALLIGGEPGVGKTRLAEEIADMARDSGCEGAWGRSWEEGGAPPFWPWIQALRSCLRGADAHTLAEHIGAGRARLLQWLPELGDATDARAGEQQASRFQLFEGVVQLLRALAAQRPLAILLDDMHTADEPTLRLLRFVVGDMADLRMLLVLTYRDTEVGIDGVPGQVLGSLLREPVTHSIALDGLDIEAVCELMTSVADKTPSSEVVQAVFDRTSGNPLLVTELVRLGASSSPAAAATEALPIMTRQVIAGRVKRLSPSTQRILSLASVVGREFPTTLLASIAPLVREEVASALDEALTARIVSALPGEPGSYRFHHALVRDAVYLGMPTREREQVHHDIAETLARQRGDTAAADVATIAHHHAMAADVSDPAITVYYCRLAGERAMELLAYEEAARFLQLALRALDIHGDPDAAGRTRLELNLGDALMRAGSSGAAREAFLRAALLARSLGRSPELADAVLGYGGRTAWSALRDDLNFRLLLEEALEKVGPTPSTLRARLLARLAGGPLRDDLDSRARDEMSQQAVAMAREVGETADVVWALLGRWAAINRPGNAADRLLIAGEITELTRATGMQAAAVQGRHMAVVSHLELGNLTSARSELRLLESLAVDLRESTARWLALSAGAALTLMGGDLAGAEERARAAWTAGRDAEPWNARVCFRRQLFFILRDLDRSPEIEQAIEDGARTMKFFAAMHTLLLAESGRRVESTSALQRLASAGFADLRRDEEFLFTLTMLADAVAILDDRPRAAELIELLQPFADVVTLGHPDVIVGVVHGPLAALAAVLRRWDDAEQCFTAACRAYEQMGAPLLLARTLANHARALRLHDPERAQELTCRARQIAERHGARGIAGDQRRDHRGAAATVTATAEPAAGDLPDGGTFRLEGEYWSIGHRGQVIRLRDSKGMRILACLLAHPGTLHLALDLERLGEPGDDAMIRALAGQGASDLLDPAARGAYRARVADLDDALEEAEAWGDAAGAGRLRGERDFIARELARGLGLGGRPRRTGSIAERARLNVTRAVRTAVRRIADGYPALSAHLDASIRTGAICVYAPEPGSAAVWSIFAPGAHATHGDTVYSSPACPSSTW